MCGIGVGVKYSLCSPKWTYFSQIDSTKKGDAGKSKATKGREHYSIGDRQTHLVAVFHRLSSMSHFQVYLPA